MRTPHRRLHVLARWLLAPLLVLLAWTSPSDGLAYVSASGPRGAEAPQGQDATPTPPPPEDRVEPGLRSAILAAPGQRASFLVYLSAQADLSGAYAIDDWEARGRYVFERLQETARASQAGLLQVLQVRQASADVVEFRPYYIVNAIGVSAGVGTLDALSARPDVAFIEAMRVYPLPEPIEGDPIGTLAVEWGVQRIGADRVWAEFGVRGQGIVVANIDTGVLYTHPALDGQYRGAITGSHDYNWFDPSGSTAPFDNNGHGTHVMGTMVGDDGGSNQIGIAPQATWIAAKGCASNSCSSQDLLASAEWILAPYPIGGSPSNGDPSRRPNVVNNSWGGAGGDLWYQQSVQAWRAAGIFPAFAAGNSGPSAGSIGSPGDYAESFASGATDNNDAIASFSSRGPSSLTSETKPDVSSPGYNIRSAWNNGGYSTISGTSMASPHTAGCVALIRSANTALSVTQVEDLLTSTALDLGAAGPDTTFGFGRINCYAAVSRALGQPTPTPGTSTSTATTPPPTLITRTPTPLTLTPTLLTRTPTLPPTSSRTPTPPPTLTRTSTPLPTFTPTPTPLPTFTHTPVVPTNTPAPGFVFFDDFETDLGWARDPLGYDTATTGVWERADPQDTNYGGPMQLGNTVSGLNDLVTGPLAGSSVGVDDVDGGFTSIFSPEIALPNSADIQLSFFYYMAHLGNASPEDFLRVTVVGLASTQLLFEEVGSPDLDTAVWQEFTISLDAFAGQNVYFVIEAADEGSPSLVEAAVDDVSITVGGTPPTATSTPLPTATVTLVTPTPTATPLPTATASPLPPPTNTPPPGFVFFDDFETDLGWARNTYGTDTAITGLWERADPQDTDLGGPMQLGTTVSGSYDLVTGPLAGSSVGEHDIDGGATSIRSPDIDLPLGARTIHLTFYYYLAHLNNATADDYLRVRVVWGSSSVTVFEETGAADQDNAAWARASVNLDVFAGATIYLLIEAADDTTPSLVEAAIDDVSVTIGGTPPTATPVNTPIPPTATPGLGVVWSDSFETDLGWVRNPYGLDPAITGLWERADPQDTDFGGAMQLGSTVSGSYDLVTGPLAGSSVGDHDIDGGYTSIRSPGIYLPPGTGSLRLTFYYYQAHLSNATADDYLRVRVVWGSSSVTVFEEDGAADQDNAAWAQASVNLDAFAGQTIYLLFEAADEITPSLVEAGIDDVVITVGGP